MGILDDTFPRWGLGLLNGAPIPEPSQAAPFGFAPMLDGIIPQARPLPAYQWQNPPLSNLAEPLIGDGGQFSHSTAWGNRAADIGSKPTATTMIQPVRAQLPDWRDQEARDNLAAQPSTPGVQATYPTAYDRRQHRLGRQGLPPDFGNKTTDIPTLMASGAARSLLTLPQRAMDASRESFEHKFGPGPAGISDSDPPWRDPLPDVAAETALTMMGGGLRTAGRNATAAFDRTGAKIMDSRSARLYDPPVKPPRPFEADYPMGVSGEPGSPLLVDNRGTALTARTIVGRRTVGGPDEALAPERLDPTATGLVGSPPEGVTAGALPGKAVGVYREIRGPEGPERTIAYLKSLEPHQVPKVIAHEVGHAIDELAGQIPTDGLNTELRQIYNTLNTGQERSTRLTGPQHMGYGDRDIPRELMAEAIRAYATNPNYIKTVAPKTAARIREYVNNNPRINGTIQFNSGGGGAPFFIPDQSQ